MDYVCPAWRSAAHSHVRRLQVLKSSVFTSLPVLLGPSVTGRFTRIWAFHYSLTTSEP
jgi:hypothetical protein